MRRYSAVILISSVLLGDLRSYAEGRRVWAEQFVGMLSTKWDLVRGETQVTDIYLQIVGPSDIGDEAAVAATSCATLGLKSAYQAYYYSIGETSAKLAQAYAAFRLVFLTCIQNTPGTLADKFDIAIGRKNRIENGIFVSAEVANPNAFVVEKYFIENAPKDTQNYLRIANKYFNPSWSASQMFGFGKDSSLNELLPKDVHKLGLRIPELPIERYFRVASEFSKAVHINLPNVDLPKIKSPF